MYAVIEFEGRECATAPICWLTEQETKCYWPRTIRESTLIEYIKTKKQPRSSWRKCNVIKVLFLAAEYADAEDFIEKAVAESGSSDTNTENTLTPLSKKTFLATSRRLSNTGSQLEFLNETPHFFDDEVEERNLSNTTVIFNPVTSAPETSTSVTSIPVAFTPLSTPSRSSFSTPREPSAIWDLILEKLEHIKAVQDQHCIMLSNIERNQQTSSIQQLQRPPDMPDLPVKSSKEFKALEEFLKEECKALYMRRRLAAVGGSSVRNTVMNILKFILCNRVAMKYSWSGRDKRAFKSTSIMAVINEAVKLSYSGKEPADLTDTNIANAVKDWLKLAKHRYTYNNNKEKDNW